MGGTRKIKLGFIRHGVGRTWNDWRHPDKDVNASTSFPFYRRQAQLACAAPPRKAGQPAAIGQGTSERDRR